MLDVVADRGQRAAEAALHRPLGEADLPRDLAVGVAAEVGQLDHLGVLRWKGAHRVIDCVTHHRAGKVLPRIRSLGAVQEALDEDLLQAFVRAAHTARVDRSPPGARHKPCTPAVIRADRDRLVLEISHCLLLRPQ